MVTISPNVIPTLMKPPNLKAISEDAEAEAKEEKAEEAEKDEVKAAEKPQQKKPEESKAEDSNDSKPQETTAASTEADSKSTVRKPKLFTSSTSETATLKKSKTRAEIDAEQHPNALPFREVPWMSPFMFLPPYLEVSYKTCSLIFLRPPLPQPDRVEIPSPHPPELHSLAYEWYSGIKKSKTKRPPPNYPLVVNGQSVKLKPRFDLMLRRRQHADRDQIQESKFGKSDAADA
jgi:hypothetical protein